MIDDQGMSTEERKPNLPAVCGAGIITIPHITHGRAKPQRVSSLLEATQLVGAGAGT